MSPITPTIEIGQSVANNISYLAQSVRRVLRLKHVMDVTGLGRSTIYSLIDKGEFPRQIKLAPRAVGWLEEDVFSWLSSRKPVARVKGVQS